MIYAVAIAGQISLNILAKTAFYPTKAQVKNKRKNECCIFVTYNHISMKNLLFTFCFVVFALSLQAQITVTTAYFPAAGDTLRTAIDDQPVGLNFFTPPGGSQNWIFTSLEADQTRTREVKAASEGTQAASFPNAELMIQVAGSGENYINVTNNNWEYVGFAGQDPVGLGINVITNFTPPVVDRHAPLAFFDINPFSSAILYAIAADDVPGGIFDQLPVSPDSIRLRVAINTLDVVDGFGTLAIPGGTYEVLREKRTEYREARLDAKVPIIGWLDITDIALQSLPIPGLGVDTTISHRFWSNEIKEPVVILTLNNEQNAVTTAEFKYDGPISGGIDPAFSQTHIRLYPNPGNTTVQMELSNLPFGDYQMQLLSAQGQMLQQRALSVVAEKQTEAIDVAALPDGSYLCLILSPEGQLAGFKQLVVQH